MNERSYYTDSYTIAFSAVVMETTHEDGRWIVRLDHTYFYPTSGGQPHDSGVIDGIAVNDVSIRAADGAVLHVLENEPKANEVSGTINWERRFDHMQQHTGQHILSQAFIQIADAETVGFHLSDDTVTIDLDTGQIDEKSIVAAENLANQVVWQNRPVVVRWASREEAQSLPLRKVPTNSSDRLRLIDILDFDLTACGGTHVARTGEVGLIKVLKSEVRNQKTRIHFCCGRRALDHYRSVNQIVRQLTAQLTTGATELSASVSKLQDNEKESRRKLKWLQGQLDTIEMERLLGAGQKFGENTVIIHIFEDDAGKMRGLASRLAAGQETIALLASTGERTHLAFSRSADAPGSMKKLLQITLQALGSGSGGGSEAFAQGAAAASDSQTLENALKLAAKELLNDLDTK